MCTAHLPNYGLYVPVDAYVILIVRPILTASSIQTPSMSRKLHRHQKLTACFIVVFRPLLGRHCRTCDRFYPVPVFKLITIYYVVLDV